LIFFFFTLFVLTIRNTVFKFMCTCSLKKYSKRRDLDDSG
jgi:hypothetical protein